MNRKPPNLYVREYPCLYRFKYGARRSGQASLWLGMRRLANSNPPKRYGIVDLRELSAVCDSVNSRSFRIAR
jgi:hypothetical protein